MQSNYSIERKVNKQQWFFLFELFGNKKVLSKD
jgi:hypothetical protein